MTGHSAAQTVMSFTVRVTAGGARAFAEAGFRFGKVADCGYGRWLTQKGRGGGGGGGPRFEPGSDSTDLRDEACEGAGGYAPRTSTAHGQRIRAASFIRPVLRKNK